MWLKATGWLPRACGHELGELWILLALGLPQLSKGHGTQGSAVHLAKGGRGARPEPRREQGALLAWHPRVWGHHLRDPIPWQLSPASDSKRHCMYTLSLLGQTIESQTHPLAGNASSRGDVLLALVHREAGSRDQLSEADSDLVCQNLSLHTRDWMEAERHRGNVVCQR